MLKTLKNYAVMLRLFSDIMPVWILYIYIYTKYGLLSYQIADILHICCLCS